MGCERDAAHVSARPPAPWNPARRTPRWLAAAPQRPRRPFPQPLPAPPSSTPPRPARPGTCVQASASASASPARAQQRSPRHAPRRRPLCLILASHVGIPLSVPIRGSAADPALTGLGEEG